MRARGLILNNRLARLFDDSVRKLERVTSSQPSKQLSKETGNPLDHCQLFLVLPRSVPALPVERPQQTSLDQPTFSHSESTTTDPPSDWPVSAGYPTVRPSRPIRAAQETVSGVCAPLEIHSSPLPQIDYVEIFSRCSRPFAPGYCRLIFVRKDASFSRLSAQRLLDLLLTLGGASFLRARLSSVFWTLASASWQA